MEPARLAERRCGSANTIKWSPGAVIRARHEGVGLSAHVVQGRRRRAASRSATTPARCASSRTRRGRVTGRARCRTRTASARSAPRAVVLGCGGFEANPEWRARYLGRPVGPRQGARHPLQHRRRAPHGDRDRRAAARPVDGLPLDAHRRRGAAPRRPQADRQDEPPVLSVRRARQHARPALLRRGRGLPVLHVRQARRHHPEPARRRRATRSSTPRSRTCSRGATRPGAPIVADTLDGAGRAAARGPAGCLETLEALQRRGRRRAPSIPTVQRRARAPAGSTCRSRTGRSALDTPPFVAYPVTGGITFTFGGVRVNDAARRCMSTSWAPIPGLYACGEMVGGLFHGNYPGGTGLDVGRRLRPHRRRRARREPERARSGSRGRGPSAAAPRRAARPDASRWLHPSAPRSPRACPGRAEGGPGASPWPSGPAAIRGAAGAAA